MQHLTGNRRMGRLLTVALLLGLALAVVSAGSTAVPTAQAQGPTGASSQDSPMNPPRLASEAGNAPAAQPNIPNTPIKKAVVVKSWDQCTGHDLWNDVNANWIYYGTVPVFIDYQNADLCSVTSTITLSKLQASHAHTLIISNPVGLGLHYSANEISAIKEYAQMGHNVLGSYLLLYNGTTGTDNRGLAVLFGLNPKAAYGDRSTIPTYKELAPLSFLFKKIGNPYPSEGYAGTQTPADGTWDAGDRGSAVYKARTSDKSAVILQYNAPAYRAVWITSWPEYQSDGNVDDLLFIYNVISH